MLFVIFVSGKVLRSSETWKQLWVSEGTDPVINPDTGSYTNLFGTVNEGAVFLIGLNENAKVVSNVTVNTSVASLGVI